MSMLPTDAPPLSVETRQAARSALQLGLSLFATWSVALVVRLFGLAGAGGRGRS